MRCGEVPAGDHHIIEHLLHALVEGVVMGGEGEGTAFGIEAHGLHGRVEADVLAYTGLAYPALDVVPKDFTWRVGGNGTAKMLVEAVVSEFQALLRSIRPKVAVHAAVHWLTMFVQPGAPGVVPHAAPVSLFL